MAKLWRVQNARTLHLVDLDAAHANKVDNRAVIREIAQSLDIPVEVGGGFRTMDDIAEMLDAGVYRVVLGTAAVREPDFVEEAIATYSCSRVVVGIDAREREVLADAREHGTGVDAVDFALEMERRGVRRIVYVDVARDGMLCGPDIPTYRILGENLTRCRITASGGVSGYRDLLRLQELTPLGLDSVIVGRALYENQFPCQQFWCWHRKDLVDLDIYSTARLAVPLPPGSCD